MLEIIIPNSVVIKMDMISVVERYPSVEVNVIIELTTFSGLKHLNFNSLWLEYKAWDDFSSQLSQTVLPDMASLSDMSEALKIVINRGNGSIDFCLYGKENFTNDEFSFQYKRAIDTAELELITSAFQKFEKWW
jgi:hypothetical protein